ncbi:MAG TPA: Ig-like domain-containing protein [Vulgatibacter sp.]|nr:Ig-like domain-containing protein [Vulgatibacter sp.]
MRSSSAPVSKALLCLFLTLPILQACGGKGPDLVGAPTVATILVEPPSLDLELHEERTLDAVPVSEDGARMRDLPVSFRSDDPEIAKVDGSGKVTGVAPGSTVVRLECEGTKVEVPVRVWAPVHSVRVDPQDASPVVGQEVQLVATAFDEFGLEVPGRTFAWSSSRPEVAVVDGQGMVLAVRAGSTEIVAAAGEIRGSATVVVRAAVDRIEIDPPEDYVRLGNTTRFQATVWDARGRKLDDRAITWSSTDPSIATVDEGGVARGIALGNVEILATADGVSGRAPLEVRDVAVARVEIVPASPRLFTGDTLQLQAIAYDRDDNVLTGRPTSWKVVEIDKVAAIDPVSGVATAQRPGVATIEVLVDGVFGRTDLHVRLRLVDLTAGDGHTCGLSPIGQAWCWGSNENGQLGQHPRGPNRTSFSALPVETEELFASISAGDGHSCAVALDGGGWCWGRNDHGQLGNNSTEQSPMPVRVGAGLRFHSIEAGNEATCGLAVDGKLWCWGRGTEWQLGNEWPEDQHVPVASGRGLIFDQVSLAATQACAVTAEGDGYCWGRNVKGLGQEGAQRWPIPLAPYGDLDLVQIDVGDFHACGLTRGGEAWCWGDRDTGSLGDGYVPPPRELPVPFGEYSNIPVQVLGGHRFVDLVVGGMESCGVKEDGSVWCWGFNVAGSHPIYREPVPFDTDLTFRKIVMGRTQTCGVTDGDVVYCWGVNTSGEVGQPVGSSGNTYHVPLRLYPEDVP